MVLVLAQFAGSAHANTGAQADPTSPPAGTAQTTADAMASAESTGQPVEVLDELSKTTAIYAMPDGTMRAEIASGPVREPDLSSATGYTPIDTTLADTGPAVTPAVTDATMSFSDGGAGPLASLAVGGDSFTEDWLSSLPTPALSGDSATYSDVQPGIDLTLQARATGYEQSWVIPHKPTSPLTLDIPLALKGLHASVDGSGGLVLTDDAGHVKAQADPAQMFDSSADAVTGQPEHTAIVPTTVVHTPQGWMLEVTPDSSFFDQPDLVWPVTLDPTTDLAVKMDYYVNDASANRDTSYRTSTILQTGEQDGSTRNRTFIQFYGLGGPPSGSSSHVLSSTLNLWEKNSSATTCTGTWVDVHALTSAMSTGNMTWNTQPSFGGTVYAYAQSGAGSTGCPAGWIHLTDTSSKDSTGNSLGGLVQSFVDGTAAQPWQMTVPALVEDGTTTTWKQFVSYNDGGSHIPTLTVNYNNPPLVPSSLSPAGGSTILTSSVTLHAIYSDPNGTTGNVDYTLTDATAGQTVVTDGHNPGKVASGSDDPYTVPGLTPGHSYSWTARANDGTDYSNPTTASTLTVLPTPPSDAGASGGALTWTTAGQVVVTATGGGSTTTGYQYRTKPPGGTWSTSASGSSVPVSAEGETQVQFKAVDAYGQTSPDWAPAAGDPTGTVRIDRTPPTQPALAGGSLTWRSATSATITATATDAVSGVDHYNHETSSDGTYWSDPVQGSSVTISTEGQTDVRFQAVDAAGNATAWQNGVTDDEIVRLDHTPPATPTVTGGSTTWVNSPVTITAQSTDSGGSGLAGYQYETSTDTGAHWSDPTSGASVTISTGAETDVRFRATDTAGNASSWTTVSPDSTVRIDLTPPAGLTVTGGSLAWSNSASRMLTASPATDSQSGIAGYQYHTSTDGGYTWSDPLDGTTLTVTGEGETDVQFRAIDAAGNTSTWTPALGDANGSVRLDRTPPTYPLVTGGSADWQTGPVTVTGSASSDALSGVDHYENRISTDDGATWTDATSGAAVTISAAGETLVQFRSIDTAGNASPWAPTTSDSTVHIDGGGPVIASSTDPDPTQGYSSTTFDASWTPPAGMPGIAGYGVVLDTKPETVPTSVTQITTSFSQPDLAPGTYFLHVRATDEDGEWGSTATYRFTILGLLSPGPNTATDQLVDLQAALPEGAHDLTFQFRIADQYDWSDVPTSRTTRLDGGPADFPAQELGSSGVTDEFAWDAAATTSSDPGVNENATDVHDGLIAIRAIFTEVSGDQVTTPVDYATLDRTPPRNLDLSETLAPTGAYLAGSTAQVTWTPDPADTDVAGYSVVVDSDPNTVPPETVDASPTTTSWDLTASLPETEYLHIRAVDLAGNWSSAQGMRAVFLDQVLRTPADGTSVDGTAPIPLSIATTSRQAICWEYSVGDDNTWATIPADEVTSGGQPITGWPLTVDAGSDSHLDWSEFADAPAVAGYPGRISLRALAVPLDSSDCANPAAQPIATTSVDYEPDQSQGASLSNLASAPLQPAFLPTGQTPSTNGPIYYVQETDDFQCGEHRTVAAYDGTSPSVLDAYDPAPGCDGGNWEPDFAASGDGMVVAWANPASSSCNSTITISGDTTANTTFTVTGKVTEIALSPDGTHIAWSTFRGCQSDQTDEIYVEPTASPTSVTAAFASTQDNTVDQVTFADDASLIWADFDGSLNYQPIDGSQAAETLPIQGEAASWSPVANTLAVQTDAFTVSLISAPDGLQQIADGNGSTTQAHFPGTSVRLGPWSPDGQYLLMGVQNATTPELNAYNVETGQQRVLASNRDHISNYVPTAWTTLPTDADSLARMYRPYLRFDSSEKWYPVNPLSLFNEANPATGVATSSLCARYDRALTLRGTTWSTSKFDCSDPAYGTPIDVVNEADYAMGQTGTPVDGITQFPTSLPDGSVRTSLADVAINSSLSSAGTSYHSPATSSCSAPGSVCDSNDPPVGPLMYHELSEDGYTVIEYWVFYRFNDATSVTGPDPVDDQHQGDWEAVSVVLDGGGRVVAGLYSQHRHWYIYLADNLEANGALLATHPLSYVAAGTHANYPNKCTGAPFLGWCPNSDVGSPSGEAHHDGAIPYYYDDGSACASDGCVVDLDGDGATANAFVQGSEITAWGIADCRSTEADCFDLTGAPGSPSDHGSQYTDPIASSSLGALGW